MKFPKQKRPPILGAASCLVFGFKSSGGIDGTRNRIPLIDPQGLPEARKQAKTPLNKAERKEIQGRMALPRSGRERQISWQDSLFLAGQ